MPLRVSSPRVVTRTRRDATRRDDRVAAVSYTHLDVYKRQGVARCGRRATDLGFLACDGRQVREATTEPGVGRRHAVCLDRSAPALLGGREQLLDWVQFGAHDGEA